MSESILSDLATKSDLIGVKSSIQDLQIKIIEVKHNMIRWMVALLAPLYLSMFALIYTVLTK